MHSTPNEAQKVNARTRMRAELLQMHAWWDFTSRPNCRF